MKVIKIAFSLILISLFVSCSIFKSKEVKNAEEKMNFSFSKLDKKGLIKDRGTSLAYEFCIPNTEANLNEIKAIDETIAVYKSSKGRIGCSKEEILCIGETADKDYKKILIAISNKTYVKSINESFFE
ncbi:MAG: hypothetical protein ABF242_06245 [Flavobacteriales bacterium]